MQRVARRLADERGQSLVLALLVLTVLAISLGGVIFFTSANQRDSSYQKAAQVATSLAEAGVNNGISVLANPANSCCLEQPWGAGTTAVLPDNSGAHPAYTTTYPGGSVQWWGILKQSTEVYTLHGKATVQNPTGGAPIVKWMSATVQVNQPQPGNIQVGVWNSIYSPFGPSAGCDTTVAQGVNMNVPLYVGGNLCLANGATITAPTYVGGFMYDNNKQAMIGSKTSPVVSRAPGQAGIANPVHIGSYCQVQNGGTLINPCQQEPTSPPGNTNVWLSMSGPWDPHVLKANMPDFSAVTAPEICWAASTGCPGDLAGGWYNVASPGPLHPCQTSSGTVPIFDNDTSFGPDENQPNGSVPGTFNLTPPTSYTCKTAQGELSWNATTRVLTVYGTIFIDGNVTATTSGNAPITYTGWGSCTTTVPCDGVIYVTGTVNLTSVILCAQVSGSNCDWTNWNPNKKILVFLANGQGSQTGVGAGQGINVGPSQTSFQGGLYANYQVVTGQSAATQGPLVSGTQTVVTGQQFQGSFPTINILPISIQGPPQAFYIGSPFNYCYGSSCPSGA